MATTTKTQIIAEAGKQELFIIREFDAPRALVFKAFTTPKLLLKFYAPFGAIMKFNYADFKNRGSYSWSHSDGKGKIFCTFKGVIHEIVSPERIIQTVEMEGLPEGGNVMLEVFSFEEIDNNRTKLIIQDVFRSLVDRDEMIKSGFESGVVEIFNQLDELLRSN
jgi:uncharacterized protein YndB with AHSA1/START domain